MFVAATATVVIRTADYIVEIDRIAAGGGGGGGNPGTRVMGSTVQEDDIDSGHGTYRDRPPP